MSYACQQFQLFNDEFIEPMKATLQKARALLIIIYWFLLLQQFIESVTTCNDDLTANDAKPTQSDVLVALQRSKTSVSFDRASFLEVVVMSCLLSNVQSPAFGFVLINDLIAVRARHVGFGACTPNDRACCAELQCYDFPSCTTPPFLSSTTDWNNRQNYCPMPYFYIKDASARLACGSLANTPDMASCYRYGCSRKHVPYQYYMNRVMLVILCIIGFLSF